MAVYFDPDAIDSSLIPGSGVLMIGYGNQGRAQALNLRDSGVRVSVGLYPGSKSWSKAVADGFEPVIAAEAVSEHDFLVLCTPDMKMESVYREAVAPHLRPAAALCFSHGFNIRYGLIVPPPEVDVVMVSPKGAGYGVRGRYEAGSGVPGLIAVHQDATGQALNRALSYAWGIGCARSVLLETTFAEETESDLLASRPCFAEEFLTSSGWVTKLSSKRASSLRSPTSSAFMRPSSSWTSSSSGDWRG
ncbi:MAG: NAD(P)-binding domain-containing protein [Fimbriimonadaceae bacterium]|nr:NAD(P)-binding domain-containing protein [Fimbriimonadaceae bacterium]